MSSIQSSEELLVRAFVPFYADTTDLDFIISRKQAMLVELTQLSGSIELCDDISISGGSRNLRFECISLARCPQAVRRQLSKSQRTVYASIILRVTLKCSVPMDSMLVEQPSLRPDYRFASELRERLSSILLAANVAKPGSMEVGPGMIYSGKRWLFSTDQLITDFQFAERLTRTYAWPPIHELPIQQVLIWCPLLVNQSQRQEESSVKLARALNAVTYMFGEWGADSEVSMLFYALVGLEALYADGKEGLAAQINSKAQALLGELTMFKKSLKRMYNIRSRFIHGELDFPPSHVPFPDSRYSTEFEEVEESAYLAAAVLVATLQEMCRRGVHELRFVWVLAE